jgi:3'-5' exoribonuclease
METLSLRELTRIPQDTPTEAEVKVQLSQCQQKTTKNNKPYLDVTLSDSTQSVTLKIWEDKPSFNHFNNLPVNSYISVHGHWQRTKYGMEGIDIEVRPLEDSELAQIFGASPELLTKQTKDWNTIQSLIAGMNDPRLRGLCELFCKKYKDRLHRTAAARNYHHARRGGIIEHVAGMMLSAQALAPVYPELNLDLILAGCLFHDAGKMWENSYPERDLNMPYSELGEMLGHIPIGIELINKLWDQLLSEPEASSWLTLDPPNASVKLHLLHLVASHHGEIQYGSPVVPKTPEAIMLHYIDNIDAKIEMFRCAYADSEMIAPNIYRKRSPLPSNEVRPLPRIDPLPTPKEPTVHAGTASDEGTEATPAEDTEGNLQLF